MPPFTEHEREKQPPPLQRGDCVGILIENSAHNIIGYQDDSTNDH